MTAGASRVLTMISSSRPTLAIDQDPAASRAAAGWEFRFVAEGLRAREMVQLYRELGFEVAADPVAEEDIGEAGPHCDACRSVAADRFLAIYTRRGSPSGTPGAAL